MREINANMPTVRAKSGTTKQLVIILHGWGADGANLIDIGEFLGQNVLPDAHFIAPNAPQICEANPFGFQWFSLQDRNPEVMLKGAREAEDHLNSLIDSKLEELGLTHENLALVGFSQGTMLSLHTGLRRDKAPKCIVGFSGALLGADVLKNEIVSRPPVCLIHGEMDDVVPFGAMLHAEEALKECDVNVETHARPGLPHSIDMPGLQAAAKFLEKHLK